MTRAVAAGFTATAITVLVVVTSTAAARKLPRALVVRNGPWIAYSTAPACAALGCSGDAGSDVLMIRAGGTPVLVAGRHSPAWNICPAFSPNGRMLAIDQESAASAPPTLVVVRIGARGPTAARRRVLTVRDDLLEVHCPQWSSDSSRLAYVAEGKVVVVGLDGSRLHRRPGDPTIHDFRRSRTRIPSPTRELIAWERRDSAVVISRPDGSDQRIIPSNVTNLRGEPSYGIAGWSPTGDKILLMYDVGGFLMRAVSVDPPFRSRTIVDVRVAHLRSWPGYGDVSWQARPR
jgi:hypothetical protein